MTDQELKKLRRTDLLELMLQQSKENERLQTRLKEVEEQLASRRIVMNQAGTMAEAALQLNRVFEAADDAALQYLENVRKLQDQQEDICRKRDKESRAEAERRLTEAHEEADKCVTSARAEAEQCVTAARAEAEQCVTAAHEEAEQCVTAAHAEAEQCVTAAREEADRCLTEARAEAEQCVSKARAQAERLETETEEACRAMTETASKDSQAYWDNVKKKLDEYVAVYEGLEELLAVRGWKDR